jgi:hypothetical protein
MYIEPSPNYNCLVSQKESVEGFTMAKKVILSIGRDLDDTDAKQCCADIKKKTSGRVPVEFRRSNEIKTIIVALNGYQIESVIRDVFGKRCRHMDVTFT